jgi:tetratricopeptide (TPR) repeat protein
VAKFVNESFVSLRIDKDKFPQVAEKFGVGGIPDTLFVTAEGRVIKRILGFMPAEPFLAELKKVPEGYKRLTELEAQVAKDDKDPAVRLELGNLLKGTGDRAAAEKHLRAVIELDKDNAKGLATEAWWSIADAELTSDEPDIAKAKEALEKVKSLDPKNEKGRADDAACGLAMVLMDQDPTAAKAAFEKLIAEFPKTNGAAQAMFMIAALKANVDGDLEGAEAGMKALAEQFPDDEWGKRAKDAVEQIQKMRGAKEEK